MEKIKVHSVVDLITNSSTTIFTDYLGSVKVFKELVTEFIKVAGMETTFDDMFIVKVMGSDYCYDRYFDRLDDDDEEINDPFLIAYMAEENWQNRNKMFDDLFNDVINDIIEKPQWMIEAEEYDDETYPDNELIIIAKDKKYTELAEKFVKFIKSPDNEGSYQ